MTERSDMGGLPVPVTQTLTQTKSIVIGILTLPLFGLGLIVLLSVLLTKTRSAPCPHCTAIVRLREGVEVKHETCGKKVRRQGELVYAL